MDWRMRSRAAWTSARVTMDLVGAFYRRTECRDAGGGRASSSVPGERGGDARPPLSFYRCTRCDWQSCLLPGAESAADVHHILKAGALQKTAGNDAAIAALAVNGQRNTEIDFWWRNPEPVEGPPCGSVDVPRHPFRFAANIEHLHSVSRELLLQLLHADLAQGGEIESCPFPSSNPVFQVSAFAFDANPGQAKTRFRQLLRRIANEHRTRRQTENCSCPGSELS